MCPKGHSLLLESDGILGRWRWAAHARRCAACAEVRTAARFVEAFAARAGRWPVAGEAVPARRVRRAWKLAGALVVVALLLPLAGSVVWRMREPGNGQSAAVVTEEARSIRTVHYTGKKLIVGTWFPVDVKIEYPDKVRDESQGAAHIANGEVELVVFDQPTTHPDNPAPYRYVVMPAQEQVQPADLFTEAGVLARWDDPAVPVDVQQSTEVADNGDTIIVVEGQRKDYPETTFSERTRIDPVSHRVKGWDHEQHYLTRGGEPGVFQMVVDQVEYNVDFPESTFDTTVPAGENFLDRFSPKALAASYRRALDEVESLPLDRQETLIQEYRDNKAFNHLARLAAKDRDEIETRLRQLGLLEEASAQAGRDRDQVPLEQARRALQSQGAEMRRMPRQRPGLAPPLTKEQLEQALADLERSSAELEKMLREMQPKPDEATARAKALEAEQAALRARLQQVQADLQARGVALQRAQKDLAAAQAAAKQGDAKARARLEATAAKLQAQAESLRGEQAKAQRQLEQARERLAEAQKKAEIDQARTAAAQRALEAARARKAAQEAGKKK